MLVDTEVYGVTEVINHITNFTSQIRRKIIENMQVGVETVAEDARIFVPVRTGSLRASIRTKLLELSADEICRMEVRAGGLIVNPVTGKIVNYARYVEYGTSRAAAQSFLRLACDNNRTYIRQLMEEAMKY